jgi:TolA-binding protein
MENIHPSLQEKIQSLVNDELDDASAAQLREQAKNNPALADEVAFSQSLARALRHPEMRAAQTVLKNVIAEEGFPPPARSFAWKTWLGIASVVLLLGSATYFTARETGLLLSESQRISRNALQPLENVFFVSNENQPVAALREGMQYYDNGDYQKAAQWLQEYLKKQPDDAARLYLGIARLMERAPEKAVAALEIAAKSPEPPVREAALWYLALAQLENDQTARAKETLNLLPPDGLYGPQAAELLEKM